MDHSAPEQTLLQKIFITLSLILLFYLIQTQIQSTIHHQQAKKDVLSIQTQKGSPEFPVRLIIPVINVNANVQYVGVTPKGDMEVPNNTADVGWFYFGTHPGDKGSAVIAGHFDGENGEAGVFTNLYKLKEGDKLYIENGKGTSLTFVVQEIRTYSPGYAKDVFGRSDKAHLNLITCDGVWNATKKSYTKRLVVFADIMH